MKIRYLFAIPLLALMMLFVPFGSAQTFTETKTIDPLGLNGWPLFDLGGAGTIEIILTSDVPVNLYITTLDDVENWENWDLEDVEEHVTPEDTYEGVTSQTFDRKYDVDKRYVVMVFNPDLNQTAEVTITYDLTIDAIETIEEAGSICGLTMIAGIIGTVGMMAIIIFVKRS
ncbi:MAG: hypothetical protein U9R75_03675 [Candidatus Thermoplasmatota archaeon]|nr:hypothetical protein [Candidatus Thermoplasmatota archaeon]